MGRILWQCRREMAVPKILVQNGRQQHKSWFKTDSAGGELEEEEGVAVAKLFFCPPGGGLSEPGLTKISKMGRI